MNNKGQFVQKIRDKKIIGHRGAPRLAPENTLKGFQKAIDSGVDMIEFDVRKTKDDVFIVHHDPDIDDQLLTEVTFAEAKQVASNQGFELSTFEVALKLMKGKVQLDIELKEEGDEESMVDLIKSYTHLDDVVVTSFLHKAIERIQAIAPQIKVGCILGKRDQFLSWAKKGRMNPGLNVYALHWSLIKPRFLKKFEAKPILVWTVNEPEQIEQFLLNERIAGVVTDVPDVAYQMKQALLKK